METRGAYTGPRLRLCGQSAQLSELELPHQGNGSNIWLSLKKLGWDLPEAWRPKKTLLPRA